MDISVVVPAYNEENRIGPSLEKITRYLNRKFKNYEIIVVDDCSEDKTTKIVSNYIKKDKTHIKLLRNELNRGKGYCVKKGILESKYPLVLFSDADLATPIEELGKLIKYVKNYDVVIASRNLKESDVKTNTPVRSILGKLFPLFVNLIALKGFKDTQCGFKLFKTEKVKKIVSLQTFERFSFDVELLFIAKKLNYKIKEVPVIWMHQEGSKVNLFSDSIKMFIDLFRIRYNNLSGKYKINSKNKYTNSK